MISRSRRDSVGGGGSSRIVPCSPGADHIRWGGVARIFSDLHKRNHILWSYSWVETLILQNTTNIWIYLNSGRFVYNSGRPGDHAPFLETPGNSGRLGRFAYNHGRPLRFNFGGHFYLMLIISSRILILHTALGSLYHKIYAWIPKSPFYANLFDSY